MEKKERTTERKNKQEFEEKDDKDTDMECGAIIMVQNFRYLDHEKRGYKKD